MRAPVQNAGETALGEFCFDGEILSAEPLLGGHIHLNRLVQCTGGRYVLQRINEVVFPDTDALLRNGERLVAHLGPAGMVPMLVETGSGQRSFQAADGSRWRAFHYLEGTTSRNTPGDPADAFEAAHIFARYRRALATLSLTDLTATIEGFHDLPHRLEVLDAVAGGDPVGRRGHVLPELDRLRHLGHDVGEAFEGRRAEMPLRIVHNDAKLANVRFDLASGKAGAVIDLDTTMAGLVAFDVGELVRSTSTHAAEDADIATVDLDLELMAAVAEGYGAGSDDLSEAEVAALALAGPLMTVENAVRFLTDHLAGDRYFRVSRPSENLDRARAQTRLTELLLEAYGEAAALFAHALAPRRPEKDGSGLSERAR
jgi:N-acetylhexosamine 1-kinase